MSLEDTRTDRVYPRHPMVGVGVVILRGEEVLLVLRGRPPRQGLWTFPGGLVELGETVREAARREAREETGVVVDPGPVVDVFEVIERDDADRVRYHFVVVEILARHVRGEPKPADDAAGARWVHPREFDALGVTDDVRRIIARARWLAAQPSTQVPD